MRNLITHRALASLFFVGGVWACVVSLYLIQLSSLGIYPALGPLAGVLALAMCAAGVIWFFRPVLGMALAIATLVPQALSFAGGSIVYALHFWPNFGIEFVMPDQGSNLISVSVNTFRLGPTWRLSTDNPCVDTGIGIELVSLTAIAVLAIAIVSNRRTFKAPN